MSKNNTNLKPIEGNQQIATQSHRRLDIIDELTPELVEKRLIKQAEVRNAFLKVVRNSMKEGVHFQPPQRKGALPYLKQEGALLLQNFFECTDDYEIVKETWENDFYAITVKCFLQHHNGQVFTGLGWANSREYNFVKSIDAQAKKVINSQSNDMDAEQVKQAFYYSQLETVQQMARKRALVSAARHLPFVSELFTSEADTEESRDQKQGQKKGGGIARNSEEGLEQKYKKRLRSLMRWCNHELPFDNEGNKIADREPTDEEIKIYLSRIVGEDVLSKGEFVENDEFWNKFCVHVDDIQEARAHENGKA